MSTQIVILGTGGNCVDILETLLDINEASGEKRYDCIGFLDDDSDKVGCDIQGLPVLGPLSMAESLRSARFINGIGSHANFWKKRRIIDKAGVPDEQFETAIHPSACVSRSAQLGRGTVILPNVTIASNATIGRHVLVLSGSTINHDSRVGDCSSVASGVSISGGVHIGESCYLGTNCCIRDGITLGSRCLIGMGAVVRHDTAPDSVVVGNPGRLLRQLETSDPHGDVPGSTVNP